jgi:hypothetical protein
MKTPILGSSYVARSPNAADSRMVNIFPEIIPDGGKEPAWLQRSPGLKLIRSIGSGPIRGLWVMKQYAFVVSGGGLYRVNTNWDAEYVGAVGGSGPVSMADNGAQIFIATNPGGYIYKTTSNTVTPISDIDFPGAVTVGFIDGYFVFNQPNSQRLWVTSSYAGDIIDPLDFASAEGSPDDIVSLIVDHREVWVFGTNTVEVWYNAGGADFPLQRIQGAFNEIGCAAAYSVAKLDNAVFWLGSDARGRGIVYRSKGYTGERVSTHAVEWQIQQYGNLADAIAYTYQQDGHAFYVLIFPGANTTWVYDVSTGAWHERAGWDQDMGVFTRHRSNCQMSYNNQIVVGDYENANLYSFDLTDYTDNGLTQKWLRSWRALPTGANNLTRTAQHSLQLDCETGVGLPSFPAYPEMTLLAEPTGYILTAEVTVQYLVTENNENLTTEDGLIFTLYPPPDYNGFELATDATTATPGYIPQAMLRWSDDGGHTWSNEHWTSMGQMGVFWHRAFWRRLGMTLKLRDRVYEVSGTDPVKIAIVGAELHLSETNG